MGQTDNQSLKLTIIDTGIGIPADKIASIFENFGQADASTTRRFGGTGLGLAISKHLVAMMEGEIGVESVAGRGSCFWFTARLGKQAAGAPRSSQAPTELGLVRALNGVRALIVDDNATNRAHLKTQLTAWRIRVAQAADGPGGLRALNKALAEQDPFQIAIVDMQMPEMDGEALGRTIRSDPRLDRLRLVLLTFVGIRGDAQRFAKAGFDAYLTKPIRSLELRSVLSQVLTGADTEKPGSKQIVTRHSAREKLDLTPSAKARILIAEDNPTNQKLALGILHKFGLTAVAVSNGAEAVEALAESAYDLVLMDIQMPEMDGLTATQTIREPGSPVLDHQVPIIAVTANAMPGDREKCLAAGMNDYVSKPIDPEKLAAAIERWLPPETPQAQAADAVAEAVAAAPVSEAPTVADLPVWDRETMMQRMMGDAELAQAVIEAFLQDIPRQLESLEAYIETVDLSAAHRQAHSIKGAAANLGCEAMRQLALEMEKAGKGQDQATLLDLMPHLKDRFGDVKREMAVGVSG
jgi:CheY-like chemotaxis protein/HPt (histidine-containing phosphotransfer) domain-containing protein